MLSHVTVKKPYSEATTSKMERFVIIVNGFQPLTIIRKRSISDVAAVLDPPLLLHIRNFECFLNRLCPISFLLKWFLCIDIV